MPKPTRKQLRTLVRLQTALIADLRDFVTDDWAREHDFNSRIELAKLAALGAESVKRRKPRQGGKLDIALDRMRNKITAMASEIDGARNVERSHVKHIASIHRALEGTGNESEAAPQRVERLVDRCAALHAERDGLAQAADQWQADALSVREQLATVSGMRSDELEQALDGNERLIGKLREARTEAATLAEQRAAWSGVVLAVAGIDPALNVDPAALADAVRALVEQLREDSADAHARAAAAERQARTMVGASRAASEADNG
jgi:hypothetical protein